MVFLMVTLFSVRYRLSLYVACISSSVLQAVPWLRWIVAGLSQPGFDARSVRVGCVVDKMALGQVFPPVLQFFPCKYYTTIAPHSSSSSRCLYQKDKGAEPEKLPNSSLLLEVLEHWIEKYFQFLPFCHAMPQTVSHWSLTVEARVVDKWHCGRFFSDDFGVFACQYHSTIVAYSSASRCWSYQKDNGQGLGTIQKAMLDGNQEVSDK